MILVAEGPGEFEIRVSSVDGGGTDAKFLIDLLDAGTAASATPAVDGVSHPPREGRPGAMPTPPSADSLCVLAHVSRRGDVSVGADAWVAGPDEVLPIEGLAIATGRDDLGVRIRIRTVQGGPDWFRWHDPGEFAGSRQRADALTSLGLELTGGAADQFEIRAEVMTLGSPPVIRTGRTVEFSGVDPIVGFRFGLNAARVSESLTTQRQAPPVRVFRAKR
ncbi:hypothetical protein [Lichenibacterium dinghuense]|uniref:hypothetical protein n=1 Tax=Lichenibacterium dinghuense TaxID=2895977 RepID=UPI001F295C4B|nr:hypothetical protein [Lichenibacterium sp. 6Y81]